jgi:hypothetical protein
MRYQLGAAATPPSASFDINASFAEFMRGEIARQGELAKLSGHAPLDPKR